MNIKTATKRKTWVRVEEEGKDWSGEIKNNEKRRRFY